jgi:long-chain acyl-CoA synthetase
VQRGDHVVVVGENRPRLYAAMLAAQSLGAVPVPLYQDAATTEYVFPINNAEVASPSSRTRSRSTSCWRCASSARSWQRIWFDDPRGLRNYDEPGLAARWTR